MKRAHLWLFVLGGGVFCLFDQFLKYMIRHVWTTPQYAIKPWLGWEYLANTGIAFSLPFPNAVLIVATPIILLLLAGGLIYYYRWGNFLAAASLSFIIFGAISNFIDRILFSATIDYLRIFTGVINIADILIVLGAFGLFFSSWRQVPSAE